MAEWYNSNSLRKYPVTDEATCQADDGSELPTDIIVDLVLLVPRNYATDVHISSVVSTPYSCSVAIANSTRTLAAATFLRKNAASYPSVPLIPLVSGVSGSVVFGNAPAPAAPYHLRFSGTAQSGIALRALRVTDPGPVTSIGPYLASGATRQALAGIIKLEAGSNVNITHSGNIVTIALTAEANEQFTSPCDRSAVDNACGKPPIRTINGVQPTADGTLYLEIVP